MKVKARDAILLSVTGLKQSYSKSEYLIALVEVAKQRYASDSNESTSLGILQRLWG